MCNGMGTELILLQCYLSEENVTNCHGIKKEIHAESVPDLTKCPILSAHLNVWRNLYE